MWGRLRGFFDSKDSTKEVHLAMYALAIVSTAAMLTHWVSVGPRDASFVGALTVFLGAATGGLFKKGSNAPEDSAPQGTEKQEGGQP